MSPSLLLSVWALQTSFLETVAFVSPGARTHGQNFARQRKKEARPGPAALAREQGEARVEAEEAEEVDLCIIGGGISGLAAAITAADRASKGTDGDADRPSILLLEADSVVGGRVRSDYTDDGFILDRGFAVFIEAYPRSKQLLDYEALGLRRFLPGARVKLAGRDALATVSDPRRRPQDLFRALLSPVGTPRDKVRLVPLFLRVLTTGLDGLFALEETDVRTCLSEEYRFGEGFVDAFFAPFLEGIYLAPLERQSSRMFHFVMKMLAVGATALPRGGMQAVADQLARKAEEGGVAVRVGAGARALRSGDVGGAFAVEVAATGGAAARRVRARSVVLATDYRVARALVQGLGGPPPDSDAELPQRSVACLYFGFPSPAPLLDPVLILNGEGKDRRNTKECPINNACFPSVVQRSYAPVGMELCSVTVLEEALAAHAGDAASLEAAARAQLAAWFPARAADILDEAVWVRKGAYAIDNAQPAHYGEEGGAGVYGGRDPSAFRGAPLPGGVFVCGDHMATATFDGALESGVRAGEAAGRFLSDARARGDA